MGDKCPQYYQCMGCHEILTHETAFFDVEDGDVPYCEACFYEFRSGPFFGAYDTDYDEHNPTEKQQFCINCQMCCKGCWYLAPGTGCAIYPYRPQYCRGYECDRLRAEVG
jgi:hypothetical protein